MSNASKDNMLAWEFSYEPTAIVSKVSNPPALKSLPEYKQPKMKLGQPLRFAAHAVAEPTTGQRKRGFVLSQLPGWSSFEIFGDEGTPIGGTDMAPDPLSYLIAGVAFCLLSHITSFLHRAPMDVRKIKVEMRGDFWTEFGPFSAGETGGQGVGGCDSFTCHVIIESEEPAERIDRLVEVCRNACMGLQTIANAVPVSTMLVLNGEERPLS